MPLPVVREAHALLRRFPAMRFAVGYGSGVFRQPGHKSNKVRHTSNGTGTPPFRFARTPLRLRRGGENTRLKRAWRGEREQRQEESEGEQGEDDEIEV